MAPKTPQPAASRSESSRTTGALSNVPPAQMQQQCRHDLTHYDAANAATTIATEDRKSKIVGKTGSSNNIKHHGIGSECIHLVVDGCSQTV